MVVLDNFFGAKELQGLLQALTGSCKPPSNPPSQQWERNTADDAHGSKTWGLKADLLQELAANPTEAMIEIQSRLVRNLSFDSCLLNACIVDSVTLAIMQSQQD